MSNNNKFFSELVQENPILTEADALAQLVVAHEKMAESFDTKYLGKDSYALVAEDVKQEQPEPVPGARGRKSSQPVYEPVDQMFLDGQPHNLMHNARFQMLKTCKPEVPYAFYDKSPARVRSTIIEETLMNDVRSPGQGKLLVFHTVQPVEDGEETPLPYIRGIVVSTGQPLSALQLLTSLDEYMEKKGLSYRLEHVFVNVNVTTFKIVLNDKFFEIDGDDRYEFGIAVQISDCGYAKLVMSPMIYRPICSNGLIDLAAQRSLISQAQLDMPVKALHPLFDKLFVWLDNEEQPMLEALKMFKTEATKWSVKRFRALLPQFTKGVEKSTYGKTYEKEIFGSLEKTDDKTTLLAYDWLQLLTNKAQNLPPFVRNQIESNVGEFLANAFEEEKKRLAELEEQSGD